MAASFRWLQQPTTLEKAKAFVGSSVKKSFFNDAGLPQLFAGHIEAVDVVPPEKQEEDGPYYYHVLYDDDDRETVFEWEVLVEMLVQAQDPETEAQQGTADMDVAGGSTAPQTSLRGQKVKVKKEKENLRSPRQRPRKRGAHEGPSQAPQGSRGLQGWGEEPPPQGPSSSVPPAENGHSKKSPMQATGKDVQGDGVHPSANGAGGSGGRVEGAGPSRGGGGKRRRGEGGEGEEGGIREGRDEVEQSQRKRAAAAAAAAKYTNPGLPGHLKSIRLKNLFCHQSFEMEFGPRVTLVFGENGSGKSAIIQGLQICLGSSARSTGRGQKLATFIRQGSSKGIVKVSVWNVGLGCHRPELYGHLFTVERHITESSTQYYITNEDTKDRRIIKPAELDVLLFSLNLDAVNPFNITTQTTALKFVNGDPKDRREKYNMYMDGTLLARVQAEHQAIERNLDETKATLKSAAEEITQMQAEERALRERVEQLEGVEKEKQLIELLANVLEWRHVISIRETLENLNLGMAQFEHERDRASKDHLEKVGVQQQLEEELKSKTEELQRENEAVEEVSRELTHCRAQCSEAARRREKAENDFAHGQRELERIERELKVLEEQTHYVSNPELEEQAKARRLEFSAKLELHSKHIQSLSEGFAEERKKLNDLQVALENGRVGKEDLERRRQGSLKEINDLKRELEEKRASQDNKIMQFGGRPAQRLNELIQAHPGLFRHMPIGPVGHYMGITDSKWAVAVEVMLSNMFNRFICFSNEDSEQLNKLSLQAGYNPGQLTIYKTTPNIPAHSFERMVANNHMLVQDILTVTDPSVQTPIYNMLVDSGKIEAIVLVETRDDGRDLILNRLYSDRVETVARDGKRFFRKGETVMAPNRPAPRPRLGVDPMQQIEQLEAALAQAEQNHAAIEEEFCAFQISYREMGAQKAAADKKCAEIQLKLNKAKREFANFEVAHNTSQGPDNKGHQEESIRVEVATQNYQAMEMKKTQAELWLTNAGQAVEIAKVAEREAQADFRRRRASNEQFTADYKKRYQALQTLEEEVTVAKERVAQAKSFSDSSQARMKTVEENIESYSAALASEEEKASMVCTEEVSAASALVVERHVRHEVSLQLRSQRAKQAASSSAQCLSDEDQAALESDGVAQLMKEKELRRREVSLINKVRKAQSAAGGNKEHLEDQLEELSKELAKREPLFNLHSNEYKRLMAGFKERVEKLETIARGMESSLTSIFGRYMRSRSHSGSIVLDHTLGEMIIKVKTKAFQEGNQSITKQATTDLKELSGGERSYTTVCLLLAVGSLTQSPVRVMDEYDVFMDPHNRLIANKTILNVAEGFPRIQFVLLSPQERKTMDDLLEKRRSRGSPLPDNFAQIHLMPPPVRGGVGAV